MRTLASTGLLVLLTACVSTQVQEPHVTAFARVRGDTSEAVVHINGEEEIMKATDKTDIVKGIYGLDFDDFVFSPSRRYVRFTGTGWEWSITFVYDTVTRRILVEFPGASVTEFLPGEQALFSCASNHLGGEFHGKVLSLPDAREMYSLFEDSAHIIDPLQFIHGINCSYNNKNTTVEFVVVTEQGQWGELLESVTIFVDPDTGEIVGDAFVLYSDEEWGVSFEVPIVEWVDPPFIDTKDTHVYRNVYFGPKDETAFGGRRYTMTDYFAPRSLAELTDLVDSNTTFHYLKDDLEGDPPTQITVDGRTYLRWTLHQGCTQAVVTILGKDAAYNFSLCSKGDLASEIRELQELASTVQFLR